MTSLTRYQKLIVEATGCPPDAAQKVEDIMRLHSPTLDRLDHKHFTRLARDANEARKLLGRAA